VNREDRIDARKKRREKGEKKRLKGRDRKIPRRGADDDLSVDEPNRGPPGVRQSRGIKRIGKKNRVMLSDDEDDY
jgi:hypothetical protein